MPFGKNLNKNSASGYILTTTPQLGNLENETRMCIHCGTHWAYKPGSGTERGLCLRCNGFTCGKKTCDPCYPLEARVNDMEKPSTRGNLNLYEDRMEELANVNLKRRRAAINLAKTDEPQIILPPHFDRQ